MTLTYEYTSNLLTQILKEHFEYFATLLHKRNPLASEVVRLSDADANEIQGLFQKFFETTNTFKWFAGLPAKGGGVLTRAEITGEIVENNFIITIVSPHIVYYWAPVGSVLVGGVALFGKAISTSEIEKLRSFSRQIEIDEKFLPGDELQNRQIVITIPRTALAPI